MANWKQIHQKLKKVLVEIHEVADKHAEINPKILAIALESALAALETGGFIFPSDMVKNFQTGIKNAIRGSNESHPEVQEKVELYRSWFSHLTKKDQALDAIGKEIVFVTELLLAIYKEKPVAVRTALVDAIFEEANKQVSYKDILASKN